MAVITSPTPPMVCSLTVRLGCRVCGAESGYAVHPVFTGTVTQKVHDGHLTMTWHGYWRLPGREEALLRSDVAWWTATHRDPHITVGRTP